MDRVGQKALGKNKTSTKMDNFVFILTSLNWKTRTDLHRQNKIRREKLRSLSVIIYIVIIYIIIIYIVIIYIVVIYIVIIYIVIF